MSKVQVLEAERTRLLEERDVLAAQYQAGDTSVLPQIQEINAQLREVVLQIEALSSLPVDSSGQIVTNAQLARDDGANTQIPELGRQIIDAEGRISFAEDNDTTPSNANKYSVNVDIGTDGEVRTLGETQTVSGPAEQGEMVSEPWYDAGSTQEDLEIRNSSPGVLISDRSQPGVGANDDSGAVTSKNVQQQTIDKLFANNKVSPQRNVLDDYASYTYELGWYILKPGEISKLMNTSQVNRAISGKQLLVQSGGAASRRPTSNANTASITDPTINTDPNSLEPVVVIGAGSGRNEFFDLDFYFDELQMTSLLPGGGAGTMAAHQNSELSFRIIEPNGISLISRLRSAVAKLYGDTYKAMGNNPANYVTAQYCLVIRFYGYDENGRAVQVGTTGATGESDEEVDNYYIEKFVPFLLQDIKFRVENKLVEYNITAKPIAYNFNIGSARGPIPYNLELTGKTIKEVLIGKTPNTTVSADATGLTRDDQFGQYDPTDSDFGAFGEPPTGTAPAPSNIVSAPNKKNNYTGLVEALNEIQQQHVKNKIYSIADEYVIEFAPDSIGGARVAKQGSVNKKVVPMQQTTTAADITLGDKQSMDINSRGFSVLAGTAVVQFIDQVMKTSGYISQQQLQVIDETDGTVRKNGTPANQVAWYKINFQASPIAYDPLRRDFAYKMKYVISAYGITTLQSEYFPDSKFRGLHKRYNYWFTGLNNSVLKFEQNYNALYQIVISGSPLGSTFANIYDSRQYTPRVFQPRSGQSSQYAEGRSNEPAANAADYLYSPTDQADVKLRIIGDPAWLQQGEVASAVNAKTFNFSPFLADGTINFDASEIAFDITWNRPQDYNLSTGVINPRPLNSNMDRENATYRATKIVSYFNKGSFEQELYGRLLPLSTAGSKTSSVDFAQKSIDLGTDADRETGSNVDPGIRTQGTLEPGEEIATDNTSPDSSETQISESATTPQPAEMAEAATSNGDIDSAADDGTAYYAGLGEDVFVTTTGGQLMDREA
jgi:hypothetical protein